MRRKRLGSGRSLNYSFTGVHALICWAPTVVSAVGAGNRRRDTEVIPMTWSCAKHSKKAAFVRHILGGLVVATALASGTASAETGSETTKPGAKGTIGLALLGAEAVMTVEAIIGVKPWWGYAIGGGAGAVGGGLAGFFLIDKGQNPNKTEAGMAFLVGGLVFAVPTTLAILSATSYKPPKNPEVDTAAREASLDRMQAAQFDPSPALVRVGHGGFAMEMPAVAVAPVFTEENRQIFGLPSATSVRVPVLNLRF